MRIATVSMVTAAFALAACDGSILTATDPDDHEGSDVTDPSNDATPSGNARMIARDFEPSEAAFTNPERGYYVSYDLLAPQRAASVRSSGHSLAISLVRLDDYRDRALDAELLDALERGLAAARAAGFKIILRFTYNSSLTADAPRARILAHIEQLAPLLHAHADVIAVMQAGFIGAWGEWHSSTNGLDNNSDRGAILDALLQALPPSRGIQVRTPMFKDAALPGGPLTEAEAYSDSPRSRVGHHNDCFLASSSDLGTYASPVDTWSSYVATDGRFTAIGGETCALAAPRTDCASALAEMSHKHWSYLNREYNPAVLASWTAQGCAGEIDRRLGYRFALARVAHTETVAPGGELDLEIQVTNQGFAAPYNARPVELLLTDGVTRRIVRLADVDARRWAPDVTQTLTVRVRIPADVVPGRYRLGLRLPDDSATLADDPRYAIRLANDDVWDDDTGDNYITDELVIDPAAPGRRDPEASSFVQLP